MTATKTKSKRVKLPCHNDVWMDPSIISCVRIETAEGGTVVVVHTTEGYAVGLVPNHDQSALALAEAINAL